VIDTTPALFGLLVGFLVGLTGVGGGSLMTPFLLSIGVPAPTAIGTDLMYATVTKMVGSTQHYRQKSVNLPVALFLGLVLTLEWMEGTYDAETVRNIMVTIIAATLVLVGASLIFRNFLPENSKHRGDRLIWDGVSKMTRRRKRYTVLFGAMGGYLVGLTSIGSGSIMAIILLLLYPLTPAVVVGTDIAHATVLSLVTGLAHAAGGNVDFGLAATLLLGSIPGVLVGSLLAPRIPGKPLRLILASMLIFVGSRMLIG
jgi:uncharacterized protein